MRAGKHHLVGLIHRPHFYTYDASRKNVWDSQTVTATKAHTLPSALRRRGRSAAPSAVAPATTLMRRDHAR